MITRKFQIVDALIFLLISGVVGVLAFPSSPAVSHHQIVSSVAVNLDHAVRASHQDWLQDNIQHQNWNGIELKFNQSGWPTGQAGNSILSVLDCEAVWSAFIDGEVTASVSPVTDYRVSRDGQTCFYAYSGDVQQSRLIQYSAATGRVQVLNP